MNYSVIKNGENLKVYTAKIFPAPYNEVTEQEYVSFIWDRKSDIIIYSEKKIDSVVVRPLSKKIPVKYDEHKIYLSIDKPVNISVEINNGLNDNLLIFSSQKREVDFSEFENIISFDEGIHNIDKLLVNKDNTVVYLNDGAYLNGKIEVNNCKNIKICGNGIICDGNYSDARHRICLDILASENVCVEDITITESLFWCLRLGSCKNVCIDNVKIIGYRGNNDGIDVVSSQNVIVENIFTRTHDDSIVVKAIDDRDRNSIHYVFEGSDTDIEPLFKKVMNPKNISFKHCTLWNDFARPIEVGVSLRADTVSDLHYEDIDIIHSTTGYPLMGIHHGDRADVSDLTFNDIRIEDAPGAQLVDFRITGSVWSTDDRKGTIKNVAFKNIKWLENRDSNYYPPEKSRLEGYSSKNTIENVQFENIDFGGEYGSTIEDCNIIYNEYVKNITVKCDKKKSKLKRVITKISVAEPEIQADGNYTVFGNVVFKNSSNEDVSGTAYVCVSPVNVCERQAIPYSLKASEEKTFKFKFSMQPGKYVIRTQSQKDNIFTDFKFISLDIIVTDDIKQNYEFIDCYGNRSCAPSIKVEKEYIKFSGVDGKYKIYTANPAEPEDNEIAFTCEEAYFGKAIPVSRDNGGYKIAPEIRCDGEITYVFHNQPKVGHITEYEFEITDGIAQIPVSKLNIRDVSDFLIEIECTGKRKGIFNMPFTLFHSTIPKASAHMFAKVKTYKK